MLMKKSFLTFVLLFASALIVNAQVQSSIKEQPKVIKAAAPTKYPLGYFKRAKADVLVQVKINSAGEVVSATPITGHPILRPICVKAAKLWIFESIEDKNRERTATLTFNFQKAEKAEDAGIFFKPPYTIQFVDVEVR